MAGVADGKGKSMDGAGCAVEDGGWGNGWLARLAFEGERRAEGSGRVVVRAVVRAEVRSGTGGWRCAIGWGTSGWGQRRYCGRQRCG